MFSVVLIVTWRVPWIASDPNSVHSGRGFQFGIFERNDAKSRNLILLLTSKSDFTEKYFDAGVDERVDRQMMRTRCSGWALRVGGRESYNFLCMR